MQQNRKIHAGSRFFWTLYQLLVTACTVPTVVSKMFPQYAQGVIDNPVLTTNVISGLACAAICQKQLVCSAFSTRTMLSTNQLECRISLGEFQWTPDPDAELFGEFIGNINGYHFGRDGYLYKLFTGVPNNQTGTKYACMDAEQGTLAVPYPAFKYQALMSTPGVMNSNTSFYLGVYRNTTNASDTVWLTDDAGVFFDTKNKTIDMDQKWAPMQPDGSGNWVAGYGNGTWEDSNGAEPRQYVCRKSVARYIRSPANGVYYWASNSVTSHSLAQKRCQADGGTLAIITQIVDLTATEAFRARVRGIIPSYWVAGTDAAVEGTWVISASTTLYLADRQTDPFQRRFFSVGNPKNHTQYNCMAMGSGGAGDTPCSWNLRFLCQITLPASSVP